MGKSKKIESEEWIELIAARIKELRIAKGYKSYAAFADENEFERKQYWRMEKGENLKIKTLIKILAIHDQDLITFFKEIDVAKKSVPK